MEIASPSIRDLALRLLTVEGASKDAAAARVPEAVRVCEKLRVSLTRFAGADGFTALLRRTLALAGAEVPALARIKVNANGSLEGLGEMAADAGNGGADAAVALAAHLLGLLVIFIGEPLTLRLVRDAWPDTSFYGQH